MKDIINLFIISVCAVIIAAFLIGLKEQREQLKWRTSQQNHIIHGDSDDILIVTNGTHRWVHATNDNIFKPAQIAYSNWVNSGEIKWPEEAPTNHYYQPFKTTNLILESVSDDFMRTNKTLTNIFLVQIGTNWVYKRVRDY